jgi:hypothetical protein
MSKTLTEFHIACGTKSGNWRCSDCGGEGFQSGCSVAVSSRVVSSFEFFQE